MSRRFPPGGEPPEDWPPPKQLPKPATPGPSDATSLLSENSVALPIAYGTVRVPGLLLERYVSSFNATDQATRQKSTTYILGTIQANAGFLYIVVTAGTTGTGDGPNGTGSGQADGTVVWDYVKMGWRHYVAMAFCEGQIFGALKGWQDKNVAADWHDLPHDTSWVTLNLGTAGGGRAGFPFFPSQTDVYGNTVTFFALQNTGSDADLADTSIEIQGVFADGTHADANPADIAIDLLTHARRGAQWPSARVDAVSTGSGAASWRTYATATGFSLSWLIDQQTSAKVLIEALLATTNTDAVMTNRLDGLGWMIKFVPLGTDSITANGVTFTPNLTPAYSIGADDLIDPIEFDGVSPTETFNSFPIEYIDRATDYKRLTVDDVDMSDADLRGLVRASTKTVPMVLSPAAAVQLSRINAQRSLNVLTKYRFSLGYRFLLLEPTDLLTLTDAVVGYTVTVRVVSFEEDQSGDGLIRIEADVFPTAVGAAASYTPQANDGFKPTVPTALGSLSVLPGQAPTSVVPDSTSTRGASVDNLWPNGANSETNPPDGVTTTTAEWAGRVNVGTSAAYNGIWTRELSTAQNGKQSLGAPATVNGGAWGNEPSTTSQLALEMPCAPGDTFYISAQARWITVTGAQACGVGIYFLDSDRKILGAAAADVKNTGGTAANWSLTQAYGVAPTSSVSVRLFCFMDSTLGTAKARFDAIYARRQVDAGVVAQLGGYFVDEVQYASLKAIGRMKSGSWPSIVVDRAWYRGSNDPLTNSGRPNISTLTVVPRIWDATVKYTRLQFLLQPTAPGDNLDGLRWIDVVLYRQSVAGTTATLSVLDTVQLPITDRRYNNTTDSNSTNQIAAVHHVVDAGINAGFPAMIVTIIGVNGNSDSNCFYSAAGWTNGTALVNNGNSFPAGITGGSSGGTGSGSGGGGGCLDPETPVLFAPGKLVPLRTVRSGDLLWTRPEGGGPMAYHAVESVTHTTNLRCQVRFCDGRSFVCSVNHLLNVRGLWQRADWLAPGAEVQGDPGGIVESVFYLGEGPVVQLRIPTAKTYFAGDGCWHHNTLKP